MQPSHARLLTLSLLGAGLFAACSGTENDAPAAKASAPRAAPASATAPATPAPTPTIASKPATPAPAAKPATPPATTTAATQAKPATPATPATPSSPAAPAASTSTAAPATAGKAAVGQPAPDFTLTDTAGVSHTLSKYTQAGQLVVLEWFNPDCPISRNYHAPTSDMGALASAYKGKNVVWLAINSGATGREGAGLERNRKAVEDFKIGYPVLIDESGTTGHLYTAKTTPHMYVIDGKGVLAYAGAIDNGDASKKGPLNYVRQALDELLAGKPVSMASSKAFGCSVKYATPSH